MSRIRVLLIAAATTATCLLAGAAAQTAPAAATVASYPSYNGLALTPPMGFNDWQYYRCDINEKIIMEQAKALVTTGLARHGYDYVNLDDCWMAATRTANGSLQANPVTFPRGIKWLANYVHSLGLKFGIYEDAGYKTCSGYPGMYGHFQQDADTFAAWGVDYLKLDYCYQPTSQYPGKTPAQVAHIVYSGVSKALLNTNRKIVFSESAPAYFCCSGSNFTDIMSWIGHTGNLWRFGDDIQPNWASIVTNFDEDNTPGLAAYAGPGHWNDADMLLAGTSGTTATEQQTQFSLWAEMTSPLLISADVAAMSKQTIAMLSNSAVIAVDQDPLGAQGTIVASGNGYDVLSKPLADGDVAVALFNESAQAQTISVTAATAGLPDARDYRLTNLWTRRRAESRGIIAANVPSHGVVMYRVRAGVTGPLPPAVTVSGYSGTWHANQPTQITATVADDGSTAVRDVAVVASVPAGWTIAPARGAIREIPAGGAASATFTVTPPTEPGGAVYTTIGLTARYQTIRGPDQADGQLTAAITSPYPSLSAAFDNVGVTDDSNPGPSDLGTGFDDYESTFSAQALAAAGASPSGTVTAGGMTFTWPSPVGAPDDTIADGKTIDINGAGTTMGFLDSSSFGPAGGTGTITYTDGTTQSFTISAPDWTAGTADVAIATSYHNLPGHDGPVEGTSDIYYSTVSLEGGKTVRSVALPDATGASSLSTLHIFAIAIS